MSKKIKTKSKTKAKSKAKAVAVVRAKPKLITKSKPKVKAGVKVKAKTKTKTKTRSTGVKKSVPSSDVNYSVEDININSLQNILPAIKTPTQHKKYWWFAVLIIPLACLGWFLSQSWLVQASFSKAITYPKATVFGVNFGGLNMSQLDNQLARQESQFESKKITLVNVKKQWEFDFSKLGVKFDEKATSQAVWRLNNFSLIDKYRLITGDISPIVAPVISVDNNTCVKTLSVIPVIQVQSKDATVFYDQGLKIKPDEPGTKFSVVSTCKALPKIVADNLSVANVSFDTTAANITKADLTPKLAQIQGIIGKSLLVKNGAYQQTLTPEQLLGLLDINKIGTEVKVDWSSAKLDQLVNDIAGKVNTNNSAPSLGACQYLINSGGHWLDKTATKNFFLSLGAESSRSYTLPIDYHAPDIGNRTPVGAGSRGTIYLTFDDGMTYANQIMNYASCYGVKVTFFEIGERVGTDAVALRRAIAEGHAVQSHGHYHAIYDYGERSYDWQYNDISQSISDIMSVTGVRPTYFRPPGGNRTANTYNAANANGLRLILWGDSSADATVGGISSSQTCANVLAGAYPGASVLMHSVKSSTANAVPCIIEGLAARGYGMQALR